MLGLGRKKRPVDWGPYPLERLGRDPAQASREAARPRVAAKPPAPVGASKLGQAAAKYRKISSEHREPAVALARAPVPDDLARRAQDLKGAAYFLDAAAVGLCALPANAWLDGQTAPADHRQALVILVELADPIDADNRAAKWIEGQEAGLANVRAAEIAVILAGYLAQMGFAARAHWAEESEIDLDRLAVLAGLAVRTETGLAHPYIGERFVVAAVTTAYEAATDLPLSPDARNKNSSLAYQLGLSGAVSGIERWRRRRRPSHLGPYPVERLTRRDTPTTVIFDEEVRRVPARAMFYVRAERGDMGPRAVKERGRWAYKHPLAQGILRLMWAMKPHQGGVPANAREPGSDDPEANARAIKALSYAMGAAVTGICKAPDYVWYSHGKTGEPIAPYHKYAVVMLIDQGHETFEGACGDDYISGSQSMRAYMRGGEIAGVTAELIRSMGHAARAQTSIDSDVLQVPLMLLAGLGEQSRIGETLVSPFLGPRLKTVVVTTDMPLALDKPIDFGLQTFCGTCVKCARECPSGSIPVGEKVIFNGYETWKPDSEKCTRYRMLNLRGSACGRCIKVCPLTKDITWDGPWLTRLGSWLGINALWLKPILTPLAIWLDDKLGHGNPNDVKKWWLDLEVTGERCHMPDPKNVCVPPPQGVNRKTIRPERKIDPKDQKIAFYPTSVLPPPDLKEPYPVDRDLGLAIAARAESVPQGIARHGRGEPPPLDYRPRGT
ncbi:MAG: Fe-S protein [Rhodospirillales bacterium]|nr:Fe-S protein [Rhodospirillales bacterium]